MGLPGRTSLARILLLSLVLSAVPVVPAVVAAPARAQAAPAAPATAARPATTRHARRDAYVPGRVLVRFAAGGEQRRLAAVAAVDGEFLGGTGRTRVVELDRRADVRGAARRLAGRPGVAPAEPDWLRRIDDCDPDVCRHLQPNQGVEHGANVVAAHDAGASGAGQTVALVDTGVRPAIPDDPDTGADEANDLDLGDRIAARWHCRDTGCVPAIATPTSSHGTEVASVIVAADDGDGTTGVAPGATVVSYRVDSTDGGIPISYLRQALLHIADDDEIDVVNLSLSGSQWSAAEQEGIDAVLASARRWSPRPATSATASPSTRPPSRA